MTGADDSPPPYHTLKEEATTEQNHCPATEVTIPNYDHDPETETYGVLFENKDNRIGFIQKVILIKLFQVMAMTIVPMAVFVTEPAMKYETRSNLIGLSSLLLLVVLVLIHYCDEIRYTRPYNYMFLLAYPLSIGFFISVVTWRWVLTEILASWILFAIVVFALLCYSILALQSMIDFKTDIGLFISAGIFIVSYGVSIPFFYGSASVSGVLYCSLAPFALTAYMLYDIQVMMSKSYRLHLSPSDFVKAAVNMHIDYRYMIEQLCEKQFEKLFDDEEQ